jgi:ferric-dicitrate binding protein FerR (iron transport regulator)
MREAMTELEAGEMARAVRGAISEPVKVPDAPSSLAWAGSFLVFQNTPIQQVAAEVGAHFGTRVEVVGNAGEQTFTAWFDDPTLDEVLGVVCRVLSASCSMGNGVAKIDLEAGRP